MKKIIRYPVVLILFGLVSAFFVINLITPSKAFSELENRYLSQLPEFSLSAMADSSSKGFAQRFEQYANDQFALRDSWISLKSRCEALLGKTENNGIVFGADNYLFEKYRSYDEQRLEKNLSYLESFSEMNQAVNKYVMVIPSSYNILTSLVPNELGNVEQLPIISDIGARLAKAGYTSVDAAANLAAHSAESIYYRTDHHWTTHGAWYGYESFAHMAGLAAIAPDPSTEIIAEGFYGTYFNKAKNYNAVPDEIRWYDLPIDSMMVDGEEKHSMYDLSQLNGRDKYAMFLYANNGVTVIKNSAAEQRSIMVIKDSYANCFVPFLTRNYNKVVVVDLRSLPKGLNQLISDEKIDDVLVLYSFSNLASDTNLPRLKY